MSNQEIVIDLSVGGTTISFVRNDEKVSGYMMSTHLVKQMVDDYYSKLETHSVPVATK